MPALTAAGSRDRAGSVVGRVVLSSSLGTGYEYNGRQRRGSAILTIAPPVTAPPDTHHPILTQWLAITGPPSLDTNGQVVSDSWPATEHHGEWGRFRVTIRGKDVTYFRGVQTIVAALDDTEPFGDEGCTLIFPAISSHAVLGSGDLAWLPSNPEAVNIPVLVEKVAPDNTRTTMFEGDVHAYVDNWDGKTSQLTVQCTGLAYTLDDRITKFRFPTDPIDRGKLIHDVINFEQKYGWNGHAPAVVNTGVLTADRLGFGDPLCSVTLQNLLAGLQTDTATYTLTNHRPRGLKTIAKDKTTVHATVYCLQPGETHQLTKDVSHVYDAIFGEGQTGGVEFWRNTQYPNAPITPPAYPLSLGPPVVTFTPGGSHTGLQPFSDELRTRGYKLRSQNTYLSGDEPIIRDFQDDTGRTVDGIVGPQTWNAAFATGTDAHALDAWIKPLTVLSSAEPFTYTSRGGIDGTNTHYAGRPRREKLEQYGTASKIEGKASAKLELGIVSQGDYLGTLTMTNMDFPEKCAMDVRAGENIKLRGHHGADRLFHVAKVARVPGMSVGQDRVVTYTISGRGDDYVTLSARRQRMRDVVDQSGRTRAPRRTAKRTPDFAPWDGESGAGYLSPQAQFEGLWNVYPIPAGERGTIAHIRLIADSETLMAAALFNWQVTPRDLVRLPGLADPSSGAAGGLDPWQVNAVALTVKPVFADQPWLAYANGGPGAMQGYWPNLPAPDATVTGVFDDGAAVPFHSRRPPWLWLAVWTQDACHVAGDAAYGHRALFPGPET